MPSIPGAQCAFVRCKKGSIKGSVFCSEHSPAPKDAPSREDLSAYRDAKWKRIRARTLSSQPLCQSCLLDNRTTAAEAVDHVWPWRKIGKMAFSHNRFQSLCVACHSRKSALEARGICREFGRSGVVDHELSDWHRLMF